GSDLDSLGDRTRREDDSQDRGLVDLEVDAGENLALEPGHFRSDLVVAERQKRRVKIPSLVSDYGSPKTGAHVRQDDRHLGDNGLRGVQHRPSNVAACCLCRGTREREKRNNHGHEETQRILHRTSPKSGLDCSSAEFGRQVRPWSRNSYFNAVSPMIWAS